MPESFPRRPRNSCAQPMSSAPTRELPRPATVSSSRSRKRTVNDVSRPLTCARSLSPSFSPCARANSSDKASASGPASHGSKSMFPAFCASPMVNVANGACVNRSTPRICRYSPGKSGSVMNPSTSGVAARTPGAAESRGNSASSNPPPDARTSRFALPATRSTLPANDSLAEWLAMPMAR